MSVFITGASGGIGEACARIFAASGYDLVLVARRVDRLSALAQELETANRGIRVRFFPLDIRDKKALAQLVQNQPEILEKVDILINNAGLARGLEPIQVGDPEDWDEVIDTNVKGLLYAARAFLPQMIRNKRGHVVNLGSVAGRWVYENGAVYCASKFAVQALTEGMRLDLHGTGVRVTTVSPGMVKTDFSEVRFKGDQDRANAVYANREPLTPTDIAEMVLWCVRQPDRINIQELVVYPTEQASVSKMKSS
jgi:3-hydroxy acid dehydrogenase / malonic semialdehyde reductase